MAKGKKKLAPPHVLAILLVLIVVISILSFFAPTGQYDYVTDAMGNSVLDAESYPSVPRNPVTLPYIINLIPRGFASNITTIVFVLFCLGSFSVVGKTKAVDALVNTILKKLHGKDNVVIILLSTLFTACGAFFGWSVESGVFVPMGVLIAKRMGYDKYLGTAMVIMPTLVGWGTGLLYSGSTLLLQEMLGIAPLSGMGYRAVSLVVLYVLCTTLLCLEGGRQRKKHAVEVAEGTAVDEEFDDSDLVFTTRRKLIVIWFVLAIIFMVYATTVWGWGLSYVGGIYFMMGLGTALIDGQSINQMCQSIADGVTEYTFIALVLAFAQSVILLLQETFLMDPFVHLLASLLQSVPLPLVGVIAFLVVALMTFFMGGFQTKAVILAPILGSLSQLLGFNPQVIVLAMVFGDGIAKWFWPASSNCVIVVAAGKLEYVDWAKGILKKYLVYLAIAMAILIAIMQSFNISW